MRTTAAALVAMFLVMFSPPIAHADNPDCYAPVVDRTDAQVLNIPRVEEAVTAARNATGMDIYVRTYQKLDGIDGETWWKRSYTQTCPNWAGPDGDRPKPNILVIMFSLEKSGGVDRQSTIKYGDNMKRIDKKIDGIRGRTMGNGLREANSQPAAFQREGFTVAVNDTLVALTEAYNHVDVPFNWAPVWNWVKNIFLTILGVIMSVLSFFGIRKGYNHVKDAKFARQLAQKRYDEATRRASDLVLNTDLTSAFLRADAAKLNIDSDAEVADNSNLKDEINTFSSEFKDLGDKPSPTSTDDLNVRAAEYEVIADGIERAVNRAEAHAASMEEEARKCSVESKRNVITGVQQRLTDARAVLQELFVWKDTDTALNLSDKVDSKLSKALDSVETLTRNEVNKVAQSAAGDITRIEKVGDTIHSTLSDIDAVRKKSKSVLNVLNGLPAWADTANAVKWVESADSKLEEAVSNHESTLCSDMDSIVNEVLAEVNRAGNVNDDVLGTVSRMNELISRVESSYSAYQTPVKDVDENVRAATMASLSDVVTRMREYREELNAHNGIVKTKDIESNLDRIRKAYNNALAAAESQQAEAERRRKREAEERRRREEEERRRKREEEEEERRRKRREDDERRRRDSYSTGFGGGFGAGSSFGGGGFSGGGGGFGGGSSGSW